MAGKKKAYTQARREERFSPPAQTVGNVGLYYVCYQLSLRHWNVMPTSRNARGVDVVIYSQSGRNAATVQVKTLSRRSPVPMGKDPSHLIADYFVVCRGVGLPAAQPECFVLTRSEVRRRLHQGEKDGRVSYWLQPKKYEGNDFREKWEKIGLGA